VIGVSDKNLANGIKTAFPHIDCETAETQEVVQDLLRGIKLHASKLLKQLQDGDMERAQLGLGHAYSRAKVKFSVQKNDNHIIQAIATLDQLDKAINTFSMRVREWYSWHFPELVKIVSENQAFAKAALFIGDKKALTQDSHDELTAIVNDDPSVAQSIIDAARVSMGQEISDADMENISTFARRVVSLSKYRKSLHAYLVSKMAIVAPNLAALIGEIVGARLISHAGSLTNLSKYPASTVQILGAEKALFRALKTKGNTPKYGLIYHSSFISRAGQKNKGRISRFLANKCSIASRIDNFSEHPSTAFGEALRGQVEERLEFYASGAAPTKNADAMKAAMNSVLDGMDIDTFSAKVGKADKTVMDVDSDDSSEDESDSDDDMAESTTPAQSAKATSPTDLKTANITKKTSELDLRADNDERKTAKQLSKQLSSSGAAAGVKAVDSSAESDSSDASSSESDSDSDSSSDEEARELARKEAAKKAKKAKKLLKEAQKSKSKSSKTAKPSRSELKEAKTSKKEVKKLKKLEAKKEKKKEKRSEKSGSKKKSESKKGKA
jgi:nucleolar protein 56